MVNHFVCKMNSLIHYTYVFIFQYFALSCFCRVPRTRLVNTYFTFPHLHLLCLALLSPRTQSTAVVSTATAIMRRAGTRPPRTPSAHHLRTRDHNLHATTKVNQQTYLCTCVALWWCVNDVTDVLSLSGSVLSPTLTFLSIFRLENGNFW